MHHQRTRDNWPTEEVPQIQRSTLLKMEIHGSSSGVVSSARSEEEGCVTRVAAKRWSGFDSRRRGGLNLDSGLQQRLIHNLGLVGAKIRRLDFVGNKRRGIGRREEIGLGN
ncbi:hypothetical protein Q3G72_009030 [Acer saccharum]|nr:hypothetical protein Q3G72_009030 [Acer saccharum]